MQLNTNIGYAYYSGEGIIEDKEEGIKEDKEEGVKWYHKAAEQGYSDAQYSLGLAYKYGNGIELDKEKAIIWLNKAAV